MTLHRTDLEAFVEDALDDLTCEALGHRVWLDQTHRTVGELGSETGIAHFLRKEQVGFALDHLGIGTHMNGICCSLAAESSSP